MCSQVSPQDIPGVRLDRHPGMHIIIEMKQKSQGMAVITLVLSMVIAALLVVAAFMIFTRRISDEEGAVTAPIEKGKSVQCLAQRRRVETSLHVYRVEHGSFPASLDDLVDFSEKEFQCPVTSTPYLYDWDVGRLTCPDHP